MNKYIKLIIGLIILVALGIFFFGLTKNNWNEKLISPGFVNNKTKTPEPTVASPNAPKEFKFDRSTNLNEELEKVNPQVLNSDFE